MRSMSRSKRLCARCGEAILQRHRWHFVHRERRFFGWVWSRTVRLEHRDCKHPEMGPVRLVPRVDVVRDRPELFFGVSSE